MKKGPLLTSLAVLVLGAGACFLVWRQTAPDRGHAHPHPHHAGEGHGDEPARGPHGGRLLVDGTFTCEVSIFEDGVPPEFRVHCTLAGAPVDPAAVKLTIELRRLLGRVDVIGFAPQADYLRGDRTVEEPHSFDVKVVAEHAGQRHQWDFSSHEGRVELSPERARESGVSVEAAGAGTIRTSLTVYGKLVPNEERLAHVVPRFPGVVREVRKRVGDEASKDEPLARIESSDSLQTYTVASPIAGTVIQRHVIAGEVVHEDDELFVICDLGIVWASFDVPWKDAARVKPGQALAVRVEGEEAPRSSRVAHVSPVGIEATQSVRIRAELENVGGKLRPGLFVMGEILLEEIRVPLAVRVGGLQRFRDWDVVFIQDGNLFEIRPLELGRRDAEWVEVLSGLAPGQRYAAAGSFLLRADAGKSGASHDH